MNKQCVRWLSGLVPLVFAGSLAAAPFEPLFRVVSPKGPCQARIPGATSFAPVQKGKAYPYGTAIRCGEKASAVLVLSTEDALQLEAGTAVELAAHPDDPSRKILRLQSGQVRTRLSSGIPEEALVIETPVAGCRALAGTVKLRLAAKADGFELTVQTEPSSTARIVGPQFIVPVLKNGFGIRILTARDNSLTRLENLLGDYDILINKGTEEHAPEMVDGVPNEDLLAVKTSTRAAVKIWRAHAPVGGRLIVSVLAIDSSGKSRETFAFAVGQPSIASRAVFEEAEEAAATNAPAPAAGAVTPAAEAPAAAVPAAPEAGTVNDLF
jgi:hypothetical protein